MNITKKRLRQIIEEECAAVMADSQGTPDAVNTSCNLEMSGQPDHEIKMAYKQLNRAAKYSQSLASKMKDMPENNLPAFWYSVKNFLPPVTKPFLYPLIIKSSKPSNNWPPK